MDHTAFVFTVLFMLLGPIKVVPAFAAATKGTDAAFKRKSAMYAALFASAICAFIAVSGPGLIAKYHLSPSALSIGGGLVLLIAALHAMFQGSAPGHAGEAAPRSPLKVALSLATPGIVPPAAVAALLIVMMFAAASPGIVPIIVAAITLMMVLDFLAMFFNERLVNPGLMLVLKLLSAVLVFIQVALGIDTILDGVRSTGLFGS